MQADMKDDAETVVEPVYEPPWTREEKVPFTQLDPKLVHTLHELFSRFFLRETQ